MIFGMDPLSHVMTVAIKGQGIIFERVERETRNQLGGVLSWPVIIDTAGANHRQTKAHIIAISQ